MPLRLSPFEVEPGATPAQTALSERLYAAVSDVLEAGGWEGECVSGGIEADKILLAGPDGTQAWLVLAAVVKPVNEPPPGTEVWILDSEHGWRRGAVTRRVPGVVWARWRAKSGREFETGSSQWKLGE